MKRTQPPAASPEHYTFEGGYPAEETVRRAYDEADLNRAIASYRFFYPNVSAAGLFRGFRAAGPIDNKTFYILEGNPGQVLYTANSDTSYAAVPLDLTSGPITVELPAGPLICVANDQNFRWVLDAGLPGPDEGKGGKHIIFGPGNTTEAPDGYHSGRSTTNRVFLIVRSLPIGGDVQAALDRIRTVKIQPLNAPAGWAPTWINVTEEHFDATPLEWENNLGFWEELHKIIDAEQPYEPYRNNYGELAALGIVKGQPFAPDARMKGILDQAAKTANVQMRVRAFADRRPDRVMWPDRNSWEWVTLRPENGTFDTETYADVEVREKWFFQATFESPAMFRRKVGSGAVYWLAARDEAGAYLEGSHSYKLSVPVPVPAKLFWSITVYDAETRSEIQTAQGQAALRSLYERATPENNAVGLFFGPTAPAGKEGQWVETISDKGWFAYFRIYGPDRWRLHSTPPGSLATSKSSADGRCSRAAGCSQPGLDSSHGARCIRALRVGDIPASVGAQGRRFAASRICRAG